MQNSVNMNLTCAVIMFGKGGVVRDAALHIQATMGVERWLTLEMGWQHIGTIPSPIEGSDGNREFLIAASKPQDCPA